MSRLIDADKAIEIVRNRGIAHPNAYHLTNYATLILREAPTVDAVEVVRCKDCAVSHNKYTGCQKLNGLVTPPDFYCPFGERKQVSIDDIFMQQILYYSAYVQRMQTVYLARVLQKI